jgi:myo-inositol-1(or 4)-monophosphatase
MIPAQLVLNQSSGEQVFTLDHSMAQQVEKVVRDAGALVIEDAQKPRDIRLKGRIDLVTETDLRIEEKLKENLRKILPDAFFLAEETAATTTPQGLTWVIDPLDGTTNFAHGFPFVALSVALWAESEIIMGIVHAPLLGEFFSARKGEGATLNGQSIRVSETLILEQALVATGFPYAIEHHLDQILENLRRMLAATQGVRRPGSAAIDLAYTACGRYDGFYEPALKPWDTAAGWLLVREAGGRVTQFDTSKEYVLGAQTILASNGRIHDQMSRLLTE